MRLHAEGLVRRAADGGYLPTVPDVDRACATSTRCASASSCRRCTARPRLGTAPRPRRCSTELRDEWRALADDRVAEPDPGFVLLDESFHVTLAEAAGNPVLVELLRQVNERIRVVRMQDFLTDEPRSTQTIAEHLGIVEAVLAGDLVEAERRFGLHIGAVHRRGRGAGRRGHRPHGGRRDPIGRTR